MPVLAMFEQIRHQLMDWYAARRILQINTLGSLVSPIAEKIQALINNQAHRYRFHSSNDVIFEVISNNTLCEYLVDLRYRTCSCFAWQKAGYPCGHALAIILSRKYNPQEYAKQFFTLNAYRLTYANAIMHPLSKQYTSPLQQIDLATIEAVEAIDDDSEFDEDTVLPPNTRRPPGRPKKRRIRSSTENDENAAPQRINRCSRCKQTGHSKRTCREAI